MVIQTNEHEFKGKTLQEYLEWKYPTQEDKEGVREVNTLRRIKKGFKEGDSSHQILKSIFKKIEYYPDLEGRELDLREFKNVGLINVYGKYLKTPLTKLNVNGLDNLTSLVCSNNSFASIDFLKQLPRPEN